MRSRATSCRTIADIDWGNRIIRPSSGGLESPCRNRRPPPDQLQWNLPKHQSAVELMELALAALPALAPIHPKCCMNMDYWASGERERRGRRCGESLLGNGSAAVLVWMDSGGAAKQSGVECICAGCGHACNLSQSVSQSAPWKMYDPTQQWRTGSYRNTSTQGRRSCRDTCTTCRYRGRPVIHIIRSWYLRYGRFIHQAKATTYCRYRYMINKMPHKQSIWTLNCQSWI